MQFPRDAKARVKPGTEIGLPMKDMKGRTALVTGTAGGIGRELALAGEGAVLLLVDIDTS